jgi:hypothetical protein
LGAGKLPRNFTSPRPGERPLLGEDRRPTPLNLTGQTTSGARYASEIVRDEDAEQMRFMSKAKRIAELWSRAERIGRIRYLSGCQAMEIGRKPPSRFPELKAELGVVEALPLEEAEAFISMLNAVFRMRSAA